MDRQRALLRMGKIMMAGLMVLIIIMLTEIIKFDGDHFIYVLPAVLLLKLLFAVYINKMHTQINRDFPKEEDSNEIRP